MSDYVLFSPIGSTDPIKDLYDGAMMHICRHYKPDVVFLYLTYEMLENHKSDNRYIKTIELLGKEIDHSFEVRLIERPEKKEVQLFDEFYTDFESILNDISSNFNKKILLNVSSGTPAMKSALHTLATISEEKYVPVQVSTPLKKSNTCSKSYKINLEWETNIDNTPQGESRCSVSSTENLSAKIKKEIIFGHIDVYDYNAALAVAKTMSNFITPLSLKMLEAASERITMNFPKAHNLLRETELMFVKISSDNQLIVESIFWLQIKEKRGEFVDLIRGISPIMTELFRVYLKSNYKIDIMNYCDYKYNENAVKYATYLTRKKLEQQKPDLLTILDERYSGGYKDNFISSEILTQIIIGFMKDKNPDLVNLVNELNEIDGKKIRNIAAHTLTAITDDFVKDKTGYSCKDIISKIRKLANYSNIHLDRDGWNTYDRMNKRIKEEMSII